MTGGADAGAGAVIGTILRHDAKVTSYKIALLRSLNDVALAFPDVRTDRDVAVPLKTLARYWAAYYWPFVDPHAPIMQGPRSLRGGAMTNDMAFRPELTALREAWNDAVGGMTRAADGFLLINELRADRKREQYPPELLAAHGRAITAIARTIEMPIRYAGGGNAEWTVFPKPRRLAELRGVAVPVPGAESGDLCVVVRAGLWDSFRALSMWVEALCIHEWCLFTASVAQPGAAVDRGTIYRLLTDYPENRRPLTWERNQIDLLLMEGSAFVCPWTERRIAGDTPYALDHLIPLAVYPTNELWNLVPSDPRHNAHVKRDRIPSLERLRQAEPHLAAAYGQYQRLPSLRRSIAEDVGLRFATKAEGDDFPRTVSGLVVGFIDQIAELRNLARY